MNKTILGICIIIVAIPMYLVIINVIATNELNKAPAPHKGPMLCNFGDWTNKEGNMTYPDNIYRCKNDYQVCDKVEGPFCTVSELYGVQRNIGTDEIVFGDTMSASHLRSRWYGDMPLYTSEEGQTGLIDLFNADVINLPVIIRGKSYKSYHWAFLGVLALIMIGLRVWHTIEKVEKDERGWDSWTIE